MKQTTNRALKLKTNQQTSN
jgi:hypothetical protein